MLQFVEHDRDGIPLFQTFLNFGDPMSDLRTSSFMTGGVKCWSIIRKEDSHEVIAVPSPSNKSKYIVTAGDPPRSLKEIKALVLAGEYDHLCDDKEPDITDELAQSLGIVGHSPWDCCSPTALLALALAGVELDPAVVNQTLDANGFLVEGKPDLVTARNMHDHWK